MDALTQWLQALSLERFGPVFAENEVDLDTLRVLSEQDLEQLGLPFGPRKKLLHALEAMGASGPPEPPQPLAAGDEPEPGAAVSTRAERRQLTVMFCDLVGSTALAERLDPEELRELMRAYQSACGEAVARYEGHVAQYLGDGLMVYFGWPKAHEDDAERAVRAGLDIVQAVKRVPAPAALQVRIGIATGPVVVGETGGGDASVPKLAVGETPNLASRVQGLAGADEIVIAPTTQRLLGAVFSLEDLGSHVLRGIVEPVHAWRVRGASRVQDRFEASHGGRLTPLVGRESELALLLERWRQAAEGEGQVLVLRGEPGVGKSRIVRALRERLAGEAHGWLQYQCSPFFANTALYPVVEQIKRVGAFAEEDSLEAKLDKLEALLERWGGAVADAPVLLAALLSLPSEGRYPPLGLSPRVHKERTLEVIVEQLGRMASRAPLLLLFEDVHWIDPTTRELIDHLISRIAEARMLLLVTHRPEFDPPWGGRAQVTLHSLNRLSKRQCAALAEGMAVKPLPAVLVAQIVDKTDGVPLFVEELTKAVLESELLRDAGDRFELSGTSDAIHIPTTLRDSLMARLDHLLPIKEVAQIGAAIGREFGYELLAAVSPMGEGELQTALESFVRSELIYQRGSPPQATYVFKHALVQDAAYDSLLKRRRAELHQRIAQALETRFRDRAETEPETVAHHYSAAGLPEAAVPYWLKAGHNAIARAANREAVVHLTRGLELLRTLAPSRQRDEHELDLLLALGEAQLRAGANSEAMQTFEHAASQAKALGASEAMARAAIGLEKAVHRWGLSSGAVVALLQQALEGLGEADSAAKVRVLSSLARAFMHAGDFRQASRASEQAIAMADRVGIDDVEVMATAVHFSISPEMLGRWDPERLAAAGARLRRGLQRPERFPDKEQLLNVWLSAWLITTWLGDVPAAQAEVGDFMRLAEEQREPYYLLFGAQWAAALALFQGRFDECEPLAQQAFSAAQGLGIDAAGMLGVYMFSLRRERGRLMELAPLVKHFVATTPSEGTWRPGLALIYAELGMLDEARAEFDTLSADGFSVVPEDGNWLNCMCMLAEVSCALGDQARAARLYELLSPYARCNVLAPPLIALYGVGARYLGMLATTMGRFDEAERHFSTALELNERQGGRPCVAHTQHQYAVMLLARNRPGDRERAIELLEPALATSRELGMRSLEERAGRLRSR